MTQRSQRESRSGVVDDICDRFEEAWRAGEEPEIENHLSVLTGERSVDIVRRLVTEQVGIDLESRWRMAATEAGDSRGLARMIVAEQRKVESTAEIPKRLLVQHSVARYSALGPLEEVPGILRATALR